jgi:Asp-tRNA(Asn)/Glu-tRNA(Gln) amidotransferase A subunit family amidase
MHMLHLLECEAVPFYAAYLGQEEALPALKKHLFANIPACLRIAKGYLLSALGEKRRAQMECFNRVPLNSLRGWFEMTKQQTMMKIDVAAAMASQAIDVIITPADALPAYRRGFSSHVLLPTSYCQLFNWLHMCAGSVPMGRVMENETSMGDDGFNDSLTGAFNWSLEYASGLPVSVQVGALPYRDELCLYAMTALESVSNFTDHEKLSPH